MLSLLQLSSILSQRSQQTQCVATAPLPLLVACRFLGATTTTMLTMAAAATTTTRVGREPLKQMKILKSTLFLAPSCLLGLKQSGAKKRRSGSMGGQMNWAKRPFVSGFQCGGFIFIKQKAE